MEWRVGHPEGNRAESRRHPENMSSPRAKVRDREAPNPCTTCLAAGKQGRLGLRRADLIDPGHHCKDCCVRDCCSGDAALSQ